MLNILRPEQRLLVSAFMTASAAAMKTNAAVDAWKTLINFSEPAAASKWAAVDDRIMGGSSTSQMRYMDSGETNFQGTLVSEGGGFASVRYLEPLPLSGVAALKLRACGDGRQGYKLTLRPPGAEFSYQCEFTIGATEFEDVILPFSKFRAVVRGRPLPEAPPLRSMQSAQLGLMLSKFTTDGAQRQCEPGPFSLRLKTLMCDGEAPAKP
mmetsp:Transcript_30155/g.66063  ORF Transcript_30155/g.66063 Transcript_30155/m.66063 type:complete len:210 (+) Transcript_30155:443-1072(+)|eukprot:5187590-Pleurochrysis_carterae.AAC.2